MLQFLPDTEEWSLAGHMSTARTGTRSPPSTLKMSCQRCLHFAHMFDFTTVSKCINEFKTCVFFHWSSESNPKDVWHWFEKAGCCCVPRLAGGWPGVYTDLPPPVRPGPALGHVTSVGLSSVPLPVPRLGGCQRTGLVQSSDTPGPSCNYTAAQSDTAWLITQ